MKLANEQIRRKAREENVPHWKIAERLGVCDTTFCKWMRTEMPKEKREKILAIISEIAAEG